MKDEKTSNELGQATSAYLRSAAHQPVQWQEWGDKVFEQARQQDKPILLDIGAVWCHWCHVMDRESYENAEVARLINEHFVPVKVDRDERPDIDTRYQTAVSALTGQGGWPLTAFLTPDGKPFYGGTYFPPDDQHGRPGMRRVLTAIANSYKSDRARIFESAQKISEALGQVEMLDKQAGKADQDVLRSIVENIVAMFDSQHGGFGNAPKFPHPGTLDLLLEVYLETGQSRLLTTVTTTLERMGRGGVYDQIGGGFHRYSVDERWVVPHFEKMSYDNAGLLGNFLRAYQVTRTELFREVALGILSFVEDVLSHPGGGFYASQDADVDLNDDGDYFTWTLDELNAALDEVEAKAAALYYHVDPLGEMHHNPAKNVLFIDQPIQAIAARLGLEPAKVESILARAKRKMLEARAKRLAPFVDKSIYTAWNAMMISALLEVYKVLGLEGARDRALATLDLLVNKAYDPAKGFAHTLTMNGAAPSPNSETRASNFDLLDDQVFMIAALLDAYELTGMRASYDQALRVMETTVRRFWDDQGGGFFDTAKDVRDRQGSLAMARKPFQDSPTPAGNSLAVLVLDRLAYLAGRPDFREKATTTLDLLASKAGEYGLFAATYGLALARHLRPPVEVVVVGHAGDERAQKLLHAAHHAPRPAKHVLAFTPEALKNRDLPPGLAATLPSLPVDDSPLALVCEGMACKPPVHTPEALTEILK
jgi:uncharacterized protein YyaL (SSP411 family)